MYRKGMLYAILGGIAWRKDAILEKSDASSDEILLTTPDKADAMNALNKLTEIKGVKPVGAKVEKWFIVN
jgi:hypothetical protein